MRGGVWRESGGNREARESEGRTEGDRGKLHNKLWMWGCMWGVCGVYVGVYAGVYVGVHVGVYVGVYVGV